MHPVVTFLSPERRPRPQRLIATLARHVWGKIVLAVGLLATVSAQGAQPYHPIEGDPLLESWRWRSFPNLNGLAAQCIGEGANGTLWFGTNEGLWSFDGFEWVYHDGNDGVPGGIVSICSGPDDTMYAAGSWGIIRLRRGRWEPIFPGTSTRFGDIRKVVVARDGSLWAATAWGALHGRDGTWTLHTGPEIAAQLAANRKFPAVTVEPWPEAMLARPRTGGPDAWRHHLVEMVEDPMGRLWFGTDGGEVLCHTPPTETREPGTAAGSRGDWSLYNESHGIISGRRPTLVARQDGSIWLLYGAGSGCLNKFNGEAWSTTRLAELGMPEDYAGAIQTRDGAVWLSGRYVLAMYHHDRWRTYARPEVPVPTAFNFLLQSSDGALWIGGPNTEIQRVDYQTRRWRTYPQLNFHGETPAGAQWFLHREGRVVVREGDRWTSFGVEDGLMDAPVAILVTRHGEVWVAGSHEHVAATARFDGQTWIRIVHDEFSWGIEWRGVFESSDGSVWFSATVDSSGPKQHRAGILQYRDGHWFHHHQPGRTPTGADDDPRWLLPATQRPEPIGKFVNLGEAPDGSIWAGRNFIVYHQQQRWQVYVPPPDVHFGVIETMLTTSERELWVGTRQFGALRYDGIRWQSHQGKDSLVANSVRALAQTSDGSLWAATDRDISRFDGASWTANVMPAALNLPHDGGTLKASPSGTIWVNRFSPDWMRRAWTKMPFVDTTHSEFWTIRHEFVGPPPETKITTGPSQVSHLGNLSVFWSGSSPWLESGQEHLQFSFRLDGAPWSAFTSAPGHSFFSLPSGSHRLEVRARDRDFNIDPTPAVLEFLVQPPVWRQTWFIGLMILCSGIIATQTMRVFLERDRLRRANRELAVEIGERERTEEALRRLNVELDHRVKARTIQLEMANQELEAFSYSVSHDLRAPLRSIDGFSRALLEDYAEQFDDDGKDFIHRVRAGAQRMGRLIDDMLNLSRVTRDQMRVGPVDLSRLVREIVDELTAREPERHVLVTIAPGANVQGDARFLRIALENLLSNAWKFTSKRAQAQIEFGVQEHEGDHVYFIRDNGAGFDMAYAGRLFEPFRRLHDSTEYPGTGVGLAIVQRIIRRHGGRIWAEGRVDQGATFSFVIPEWAKSATNDEPSADPHPEEKQPA